MALWKDQTAIGYGNARVPANLASLSAQFVQYPGSYTAGGRSGQGDARERLAPYFGFNPKVYEKPAEFEYAREFQNLPEAYSGQSDFLSRIMVRSITASELWPLSEAMPMRFHNGTMRVQWKIWRFHDHLPNRRPEQAPSRLLTSSVDEKSDTIVSYGIQLMLEHGFENTPSGRLAYLANLQQIKNAQVEALCLGVQQAIIWVDHTKWNTGSFGKTNVSQEFNTIKERELRNFGAVQKGALPQLWAEVREGFVRRTGQEPNMVIAAMGVREYAKSISGFVMSSSVPGTRRPLEGKAAFREWRPPKVGLENEKDQSPERLDQFIGGFCRMDMKHLRNCPPADFRIGMMDVHFHVMESDNYAVARYQDLLPLTGLYVRQRDTQSAYPRGDGFGGRMDGVMDGGVLQQDGSRTGGVLRRSAFRYKWTNLGKRFFDGYTSWYEYMETQGVLKQWTQSLLARDPEVQEAFIYEIARLARPEMIPEGNRATVETDAQKGLFYNSRIFTDFANWLKQRAQAAPPAPQQGGGGGSAVGKLVGGLAVGGKLRADAIQKAVQTDLKTGQFPTVGETVRLLRASAQRYTQTVGAILSAVAGGGLGLDLNQQVGLDTMRVLESPPANEAEVKQAADRLLSLAGFTTVPDPSSITLPLYGLAANGNLVTVQILETGLRQLLGKYGDQATAIASSAPGKTLVYQAVAGLTDNLGMPAANWEQIRRNLIPIQKLYKDGLVAAERDASGILVIDSAATDVSMQVAAMDAAGLSSQQFGGRLGGLERKSGGTLKALPSELEDLVEEGADGVRGPLANYEDSLQAIWTKHGSKYGAKQFVRLVKALAAAKEMANKSSESMPLLLSELYTETLRANMADILKADKSKPDDLALKLVHDLNSLLLLNERFGDTTLDLLARMNSNIYSLYSSQWKAGPAGLSQAAADMQDVKDRPVDPNPVGEPEMKAAFKKLSGASTITSSMIHAALKATPCSVGDILYFSADNDLWPLIAIHWDAPIKHYVTSCLAALRAYGEAGQTLYARPSFELGNDATLKVTVGHFTFYARTIITAEEKISIVPNVFVHEYKGGDENTFWDPNDNGDKQDWSNGNWTKSYFVRAVYPNDKEAEDVVMKDLTGMMHIDIRPPNSHPVPSSSPVYNREWGFKQGPLPITPHPYVVARPAYNTLLFESHQLKAKYLGGGRWDPVGTVILEAGHWGKDWGWPGCGGVVTGKMSVLERPDFSPVSMRQNVVMTPRASGVAAF
jgi:hypothetical protein